MQKSILIFVSWYLPGFKGGGPVKSLSNLIETTGGDYSFYVVSRDRDLGDRQPYKEVTVGDWNQVGKSKVYYVAPGLKGFVQILHILKNRSYDLIYLNSSFSIMFSLVPVLFAKAMGCKLILGPRGTFSKGALGLKSAKKRLFNRFFSFFHLQYGITWLASSDYEKKDIIEVFGNKVDIVVAENIGSQEFANNLAPKQPADLKIVFISRISPKKNLDYALTALKDVKVSVAFDIYGPIEDSKYWSHCKALIAELPENIDIQNRGAISSNQVVEALQGYDLFFFPTKGENYGHVVVEALCAGLPVLISDTTPWRNLQTKGIGWDLPLSDPGQFVECIHQAFSMSAAEYREYRAHVLAWAKKKFADQKAVDVNRKMLDYALRKPRK